MERISPSVISDRSTVFYKVKEGEGSVVILGFGISIIFYALLFLGIIYKKKVVIKVFDSVRIIVYASVYTGLTFGFSLFYALLSMTLSESVIAPLICAAFLVFSWWIVEKLYEILYDENKDKLTEKEKNMCNLWAMLGIVITSMFFLIQENDKIYVILISTALAILIGEYVPISKIYEEESIKEIGLTVLANFKEARSKVLITDIVCVSFITLVVSLNNFVQKIRGILDEVGKGIIYATFVIFFIMIIGTIKRNYFVKKKK